jgi:hypothetical protein
MPLSRFRVSGRLPELREDYFKAAIRLEAHMTLEGRPHETENKVRLGLQGSLDPKKTLQNSIRAGFTESPHRDPTACGGGFTVFSWQAFVRPSTRRTEFLIVLYFPFCVLTPIGTLTPIAKFPSHGNLAVTAGPYRPSRSQLPQKRRKRLKISPGARNNAKQTAPKHASTILSAGILREQIEAGTAADGVPAPAPGLPASWRQAPDQNHGLLPVLSATVLTVLFEETSPDPRGNHQR